jgi:hypothetical protein
MGDDSLDRDGERAVRENADEIDARRRFAACGSPGSAFEYRGTTAKRAPTEVFARKVIDHLLREESEHGARIA